MGPARVRSQSLGLALTLAAGLPLCAQEPAPRWNFSGFGTLGVMATDTDKVGFIRDLSQPYPGATDHPNARPDSRLGLQLDLRVSDTLHGAVQVVSKERYDGTFKPQLTMAMLAWNPVSNLSVRAGRLPLDQLLGAESRDAGYSYLWVRPSLEVYGQFPVSQFDGVDLAQTFDLGGGTLLVAKVFGGFEQEDVPIVGSPPYRDSGARAAGFHFDLTRGPWTFRYAWDTGRPHHDWPPKISILETAMAQYAIALSDPRLAQTGTGLGLVGSSARLWGVMGAYEGGRIQAQASFTRFTTNRLISPNLWTGQASLGYRVGQVVPYAIYSRVDSGHPQPYLGVMPSLPDPITTAVVAGVEYAVAYAHSDRHTLAGGLRWDFRPNMDLKFQVDHIQNHNSLVDWQVIQPGWNGRANAFTLTYDFVFGRGR